jgi:hypothetical protein
MPRLSIRLPKYRHFAPRNLGFVEIHGKRHYLPGTYGSKESKQACRRLLVEWEAQGRPATPPPATSDLTIVELMAAYLKHAKAHYRDRDGKPTPELACINAALRSVKELYGRTLAVEFGPLALKAVQAAMVKAGMSRGTVNRQIHRVRRMFRWTVSEELLPPSISARVVKPFCRPSRLPDSPGTSVVFAVRSDEGQVPCARSEVSRRARYQMHNSDWQSTR